MDAAIGVNELGLIYMKVLEPLSEKTSNLVFRPGLTQFGLYSHKSRLRFPFFPLKNQIKSFSEAWITFSNLLASRRSGN